LNVQRAFGNRVKKQNWEQEVINQELGLLPNAAVQSREAAQKVTTQNQGKVGK
jgi:hypothetical protein